MIRQILVSVVRALAVPVGLVAAWWFLSAGSESPFFPPLEEIVTAFADLWLFERVGSDVLPSLRRAALGYTLALIIGIAAGTLVGMSATVRRTVDPTAEFLRALPITALIPLFVVAFGIGDAPKVLVITAGCVWIVFLNTVVGVASVEATQLDVATVFRLTRLRRVFSITLPSASPQIFAGARVALAVALIGMVVSEMYAAANGIGYFILQAQRTFAITEMWSGVILLGVIGYVANILFEVVESWILRWHQGAHA